MTTIVGKISVFLLAENRLLREALAKILNKKTDITVVGSAPLSSGVVLKITASSPQVLLFNPPHNIRGDDSVIPPLLGVTADSFLYITTLSIDYNQMNTTKNK